ncbi:MAG: hypothetical protein HXY38_00800 [Chloroflexi bacterium]|nr:hypothetical protein [Chloroflexota bacterium]
MNKSFAIFTHYTSKINRQHIQLALAVATLVMLVIGAGAPSDAGGIGPH